MAKNAPDSRTPRRFIAARSTINSTAHCVSWLCTKGSAALTFCTPEETDTATVST